MDDIDNVCVYVCACVCVCIDLLLKVGERLFVTRTNKKTASRHWNCILHTKTTSNKAFTAMKSNVSQ